MNNFTKTSDVEGRRISTTVDEPTWQRYSRLPWGIKSKIIEALLKMVLDAFDKHGELLIGAILSGNIKLELDLPDQHQESVQISNSKLGEHDEI